MLFIVTHSGDSANLALMQLIDRQFLEAPFYGVRQMTWHLLDEGHAVNVKRIRRLMRLMRLIPIYQKPNTSKPAKGHKTYPYLLGGLRVDRPNQVWCADITYLPMRRGFPCLAAVMDRFTRKVLAWRISNTLEADFCGEALNEAVHRFGPPEIMNTVQGSQFTSFAWTDRLQRIGTRISMDGKGRCLDNIFIERLWRSLKHECVYLHAWETGSQAKVGVGRWITTYNRQRPNAAHGGQPPAVVYFNKIETDQQGQRVAESSRKLSKGWGVAQVLAEQMLDNAMLRDVNLLTARPDAKRKSATHLVESHQVNQHWASSALNLDRSTLRYQSRRKEHAHLRNAKRRLQRNVAGSAIGRCP